MSDPVLRSVIEQWLRELPPSEREALIKDVTTDSADDPNIRPVRATN